MLSSCISCGIKLSLSLFVCALMLKYVFLRVGVKRDCGLGGSGLLCSSKPSLCISWSRSLGGREGSSPPLIPWTIRTVLCTQKQCSSGQIGYDIRSTRQLSFLSARNRNLRHRLRAGKDHTVKRPGSVFTNLHLPRFGWLMLIVASCFCLTFIQP